MLYLVAIGWMYVVLMMAVAEAMAPNGSLLGALITFALYGLLPLALALYLLGTPARRRALRVAEKALRLAPGRPKQPELPSGGASAASLGLSSAAQPDGSGHAAGDAVAPKREEP